MDTFSYVSFLVCVLVFITKGTLSQTDNTTNSVVACKLIPADLDIREELASYANDATYKLIKLKVDIEDTNITSGTLYSKSVYQPRQWMIATSVTGKSILMLRDYYSPMSLFTLGLGVAKVDITLKQQPAKCLDNTPIAEIAELVRGSILDNFESESSLPEAAEVCSQQVVTKGADTSKLVYVCCKKDLDNGGAVLCTENTETIWITFLFISILIIQGFIIAFFPVLLPDTMFKAKSVFQKFLFQTEADKSLVMNVKVVDSAVNVNHVFVKTKQHVFTHMKGFKKYIEQMTPGKIYKMHANGIDMSVLESKIIQDGSVPVGIGNFIFDFFVRCAIRLEIPSVSACCNARMFRSIAPSINVRWYQCLRVFMILICAAILASPWILRVVFYYTYEEDALSHKQELYETLGLQIPFNGFVVSYLSPSHPVFIAIYVLLAIEVMFYLPQTDEVKRKLKFTVRKCFRDMHESSRMDAWAYFVSKMLFPLARFGIVGCLAFPLWVIVLPFFLILLILEALPIANLTVRLLANLLYYTLRLVSPKKFNFVPKQENRSWKRWINNRLAAILVTDFQEENTRLNQFIHASSLIMTLLSIWCILLLAADFLSFFVECTVYALIGFILNPLFTYKYVSLILLITVYGWDCATSVKDRYIAYGKAINSKVQSMIGDRLQNIASQNAKDQTNSAFRIENEEEETEPLILVAGSERYLKWRAPRLVLFLDSSDIPFIPKSFLMRMGRLQHAICPGQVHVLYLRAFVDFALIVLFLVFVFIVIFAFGQAHDISSAGQAIVALGSGFLPLIFKKFLYKSQTGPSVDTSNMKFHYMFLDAVKHYNDRWNFEDIHITKIEEITTETPKPANDSGAHALDSVDLDTQNDITALALPLKPEHDDHDTSSTACIIGENAIELMVLSNEDARKIDVDLLVKPVLPQSEDGPDLEFYVPITRVADCEDDDVVNDNGVHLTVI